MRDKLTECKPYQPSGREQLSIWFGLSYASWLTIPRVLMQAMPDEWQAKMAALLNEYDETWDTSQYGGTRVQLTKGGKLVKMDDRLISYRYPDRDWVKSLKREP